MEGAAGAGSPAAIAAPFLVGLGFHPVTAAACALLGDATPASWGGAGVTTIMGLGGVSDYMTSAQASAMVGRFHMFGVMLVPTLALLIAFGRKGFKGIWPFSDLRQRGAVPAGFLHLQLYRAGADQLGHRAIGHSVLCSLF